MGLVLIAMTVRVVVGLILKCVFIVGGEVAVAIWALAGWGGDLDKVPKAIGQETSPAEVCRQTKRAVEPLGEHGHMPLPPFFRSRYIVTAGPLANHPSCR